MKMNINNRATTVYGFFPEIPGNIGRVEIDSAWVKENVTRYKELGKSLEKCKDDLSVVVKDDQFHWTTAEMQERFIEDIERFFAE